MSGSSPPSLTIRSLFSAVGRRHISIHSVNDHRAVSFVELMKRKRERRTELTVDSEIAQCGTSSALNFDIVTLKEKEDRFQGISRDFAYVLHESIIRQRLLPAISPRPSPE